MSCVSSGIRGQPFVASCSLMKSMTFLRTVAPAHLRLTGGSRQQRQSNPSVSRPQCQDCLWVRAAAPAGNLFTCLGLILGGVAGWAEIFIRSARVLELSHQRGLVGAPGKPGSCGHSTVVSQLHAELRMELLAWSHGGHHSWVPLSSNSGRQSPAIVWVWGYTKASRGNAQQGGISSRLKTSAHPEACRPLPSLVLPKDAQLLFPGQRTRSQPDKGESGAGPWL